MMLIATITAATATTAAAAAAAVVVVVAVAHETQGASTIPVKIFVNRLPTKL